MKIAFSARGPGPDYDLDESFGRAYWILIHDRQSGSWTAFENRENRIAQENAGIQTAGLVVDCGVQTVVTGKVGSRAFRQLQARGIEIYLAETDSVEALLERWEENALPKLTAANSQGSPFCLMAQPVKQSNALLSANSQKRFVGDKIRKGWMT